MCLVVWSNDCGICLHQRPIMSYNICGRPLSGSFLARRRRNKTVSQLVLDHFIASESIISSTTLQRPLHNSGFYEKRPVVCDPLNRQQISVRLCWERGDISWIRQQWASVLFTDVSRFTQESYSRLLLI